MSRTLDICLVSDQTIPNYLPALLPGFRPEKVVALVTPQMRREKRQERLLRALADEGVEVEERETLAFDVDRVRSDALRVVADHPAYRCRCNLTGGTKMMTVALFEAARDRGLSAYYVDTLEERIITILPELSERPLESALDLERYLKVYDYGIDERSAPIVSEQRLELMRWLCKNADSQRRNLSMLVILGHKAGNTCRVDSIDKQLHNIPRSFYGLVHRFEQANALRSDSRYVDFLDPENIRFVTGGWLEDYVYHIVKNAGPDVTDAACSLKIRKTPRDVQNELDVAFTARNRLFLVECKAKSFRPQKGRGSSEEGAAPVYKLDSLRDVVSGTFGRAMLVSYHQLPEAVCQRLSDLRIRYIHAKDLCRIEKTLMNWISR